MKKLQVRTDLLKMEKMKKVFSKLKNSKMSLVMEIDQQKKTGDVSYDPILK